MAKSAEQLRQEREETSRLEKEQIEQWNEERSLMDLINSGVAWLAVPGDTLSGHATPVQIAERLVEAVSVPKIRHGAEIVVKFVRSQLDTEEPGQWRDRRELVLSMIEHACSGDVETITELLSDAFRNWEYRTFWDDFQDAWIAIHACRAFDSYDRIAACSNFDEVRRLASGWHEEPAEADNESRLETPSDSGQAGRSLRPRGESGTEFVADAVQMLFSWQEILDAVGRPNERRERVRVKELNSTTSGPIRLPKCQGAQPQVPKADLIAWWNRQMLAHDDAVEERSRKDAEVAASLSPEHDYGRSGTVLPEISGSKRSRKVTKRLN
ncbi:hypothetical protein GC176_24675 [bacterium]|nr:hypothetical protein [bacterium]